MLGNPSCTQVAEMHNHIIAIKRNHTSSNEASAIMQDFLEKGKLQHVSGNPLKKKSLSPNTSPLSRRKF